MNNIYELKGSFKTAENKSGVGPASFPEKESLTNEKIQIIQNSLKEAKEYWKNDTTGLTPLISIQYYRIIPKTLRMSEVLKGSNKNIVGIKFEKGIDKFHIFTYKTNIEEIEKGISKLELVIAILNNPIFAGIISGEDLSVITSSSYSKVKNKTKYSERNWRALRKAVETAGLKISPFASLLQDCYYIKQFSIEEGKSFIEEPEIVTLFDIGLTLPEIYQKLGLNISNINHNKLTCLLGKKEYAELYNKAPFLISMSVTNFKDYTPSFNRQKNSNISASIPSPPENTPIVGVIDTLFKEENIYFSKWVENFPMIDKNIEISDEDYFHGTAVTSIIVDGPSLNPALEDGCGRFKVKHFGVATHKKTSSYTLIKTIEQIVERNLQIKVWNISLGSPSEIQTNFISAEAALLDELQFKHDVIFIIAGTNNAKQDHSYPYIGSPADSINSITVNSSDFNQDQTSYCRRGPVLDFFTKPDISCFGGDKDDFINVYSTNGFCKVQGTSFAAPWITRKIAFMIYKLGFTREEAKALLIDSAAGWNTNFSKRNLLGYGIVPIHIKDIVSSKNDEIRFIINSTSKYYETFSYAIPIPVLNEKFPYIAKATLCYTSECYRNCGVDYTCNELDVHIGRINDKGKIKSIDNNCQGDDVYVGPHEADARQLYRKWDTVKYITEGFSTNKKGKKIYKSKYWGLMVRQKNRFMNKPKNGINFSVVITLKEVNGHNRINEFVKLCSAEHVWEPIPIMIEERVNIFEKASEDIVFEE